MKCTMSKMVQGLLLITLFGCSSIQVLAFKQNLLVNIEPDHQIAVRLGQNQTILCTAEVPLQYCRFDIPGEGGIILSQGQIPDDGIEYYGDGLEKGQCGVKISSIKQQHDGNVTCYLTPEKGRSESYNSVRLVVARAPTQLDLILNKNSGPYRSGEKMEITCIAEDGKPPSNVTLYLDAEPIESNERLAIYDRPMDEKKAVAKTTRSVTPSDNGKLLRCVANHIALSTPLETTRRIEVYFPPQPQQTIERFGYSIGRPGQVNVTVHANPMPDFAWNVDNIKISAGKTDSSGRLQTNSAVDLGNGYWSVILNIDSVQKSDTDKAYSLEAHNSEGFETYKIILSSSSEPPAGVDLDAGSIIGIVVGVLILIVAVFLIVFARATGRWCFADDSAKTFIGESSNTASVGRFWKKETDNTQNNVQEKSKISFSQLFKRSKDKVSEFETDTMRTIVVMEDEKLPASEPTNVVERPMDGVEQSVVYAELDLVHQQQISPRRLNEDKTEYAEILYTKPDEQHISPEK